jgi:hypothetical protein
MALRQLDDYNCLKYELSINSQINLTVFELILYSQIISDGLSIANYL